MYMRAHKREPMILLVLNGAASLINALLVVALGTTFAGRLPAVAHFLGQETDAPARRRSWKVAGEVCSQRRSQERAQASQGRSEKEQESGEEEGAPGERRRSALAQQVKERLEVCEKRFGQSSEMRGLDGPELRKHSTLDWKATALLMMVVLVGFAISHVFSAFSS